MKDRIDLPRNPSKSFKDLNPELYPGGMPMSFEQLRLRPNVFCIRCLKHFYASPGHIAQGWGKYCSKECYGKQTSEDVLNSECLQCGKKFYKKPSHIAKEGAGKYCSKECKSLYLNVEKECPKCGKKYKVWKSQAGKLACSRECSNEVRSNKVTQACVECGKEFKFKPCNLGRKKGAGSFCDISCKAKYASKNVRTTGGVVRYSKGGRREDLGIYVRSGWEANYARYLNFLIEQKQIQKWEFEPECFEFKGIKRGQRFYTPDFKVTNNDASIEYHEVKGYMDKASATKIKRFKRNFPALAFVLIDAPAYRAISKWKSMVKNWEQR